MGESQAQPAHVLLMEAYRKMQAAHAAMREQLQISEAALRMTQYAVEELTAPSQAS